MTPPVLGLVVNPVAGMGGRVGLHGTDTGAALAEARARGAEPVAPGRARRALRRLHEALPRLEVLTVAGPMGAEHLTQVAPGWDVTALPGTSGETSASDTRDAVARMVEAGVRLVLFVGGDGTARDVATSLSPAVPVLGVPAGVKMHSGVFGVTPEAAGSVAARFLTRPGDVATRTAEVVDRDESGDVRLFATVQVPGVPHAVQQTKGGGPGTSGGDVAALGHQVAAEMEPGRLYLLGPGTTVAAVGDALGLETTVLGVDAVLDGRLVARDASEGELLEQLARHPAASLVLGVVGGQGFLLGRGNQQLSAAVLRAVGSDRILVLATPDKVSALDDPVLHIDLDDPDLAASLVGYRRVRTGRTRSTVLRVVA